jgi:hypothetical protein
MMVPRFLPLTMLTATAAFSPHSDNFRATARSGVTGTFFEEAKLLERSTFPIVPSDLMVRAKKVLSPGIMIGTEDGGACLADTFEFCAAVVGPIGKQPYLDALGSFKLGDAFDITTDWFGMHVDPSMPNRVWFMSRVKGVHTGVFMGAPASNKEVLKPPEILHLDFNEAGQVTEFGFYTADRRQGNTGGLGGAFGFMYGIGKPLPIPECQPYKRSLRFRLLNFVGTFLQRFNKAKTA